jgi:hypothetical protein
MQASAKTSRPHQRLVPALVVGVFVAIHGSPAGTQPLAPAFQLTVIATDGATRELSKVVWLGIRNRTSGPQLFCVWSRAIWTKVPEGPNEMTADGFSPHGCQAEGAYTIVLPNETAFVPWNLPESLKFRTDQVLVVKVEVTSRSVSGGERTRTALEWNGSVVDMITAGRGLMRQ